MKKNALCSRKSVSSAIRAPLTLAALLAVGLSLISVHGFAQTKEAEKTENGIYLQLDSFSEVFELVRDQFVHELSDQEIVEAAIEGMLQRIDPHASYYNREELDELQQRTRGQFGGLGIQVTMEDDLLRVIAPIYDTPADRAGIKSGDLISHVDGLSIHNLNLEEIVERLRGEVGTSVIITVIRGEEEPFQVTLVREFITQDPITWRRFGDIGYLRLKEFSEPAFTHLQRSIDALFEGQVKARSTQRNTKPLEGFVLDLRHNPGGLLDQAVKVTDAFLEEGEIVTTRGRDNQRINRYQARAGDMIKGLPLILLINEGSASASEIVAAALQDHKRAVVMGTQSFGKGSVQSIVPLNAGGGAVRLTIQLYYSPSGDTIQAVGITPDIIVEQASLTKEGFPAIPLGEATAPGALENDSPLDTIEPTRIDAEDEDEQQQIIAQDYQLARALDAVRVLALSQTRLSSREKK